MKKVIPVGILVSALAVAICACAACWKVWPRVSPSGGDLIVLGDMNIFDNTAAVDVNNRRLYTNLVGFTNFGRRGYAKTVLIHVGHGAGCHPPVAACFSTTSPWTFRTTLESAGYTVLDGDDATARLTTIAPDVKVIFLWVPNTPKYAPEEILSLKRFLADSGRIVFVGENLTVWNDGGLTVLNPFLEDMGSRMRYNGATVGCGSATNYVVPQSSLRAHQVTAGLTQLLIGCSSAETLGTGDVPLFLDKSATGVLGAVAKTDVPAHP